MKTKELYKIIKRKDKKYKWIMSLAYLITTLSTLFDIYFFNYQDSQSYIIIGGVIIIQTIIVLTLINIHTNANQISVYELRKIFKQIKCRHQVSNDYLEYVDYYYIGNRKVSKVRLIVYDDYLENDKMISNEVILEQLAEFIRSMKKETN